MCLQQPLRAGYVALLGRADRLVRDLSAAAAWYVSHHFQILAVVPAFISMALFGLYTGECFSLYQDG